MKRVTGLWLRTLAIGFALGCHVVGLSSEQLSWWVPGSTVLLVGVYVGTKLLERVK